MQTRKMLISFCHGLHICSLFSKFIFIFNLSTTEYFSSSRYSLCSLLVNKNEKKNVDILSLPFDISDRGLITGKISNKKTKVYEKLQKLKKNKISRKILFFFLRQIILMYKKIVNRVFNFLYVMHNELLMQILK